MIGDWIAKLVESPGRFDMELWIFRKAFDGGTEVWYGDKTETFGRGMPISKPSLILSPDMLVALQKALSDQGIKQPDQSYTEGKLEATENHLADVRHLLKLPAQHVINTEKRT